MRCERGHRKTWNSGKGWYCWSCEQAALRAACDHVFDEREHAGILGSRWYCRCGEMYVGPLDDHDKPATLVPATDRTYGG